MTQFLMTAFHVLVFPGALFCIVIGLLLAGIDRKLVARMQNRKGPSLLQPLYDVLKCCGTIFLSASCASFFTLRESRRSILLAIKAILISFACEKCKFLQALYTLTLSYCNT